MVEVLMGEYEVFDILDREVVLREGIRELVPGIRGTRVKEQEPSVRLDRHGIDRHPSVAQVNLERECVHVLVEAHRRLMDTAAIEAPRFEVGGLANT